MDAAWTILKFLFPAHKTWLVYEVKLFIRLLRVKLQHYLITYISLHLVHISVICYCCSVLFHVYSWSVETSDHIILAFCTVTRKRWCWILAATLLSLNNLCYSGTFPFCKVVQQHIWSMVEIFCRFSLEISFSFQWNNFFGILAKLLLNLNTTFFWEKCTFTVQCVKTATIATFYY